LEGEEKGEELKAFEKGISSSIEGKRTVPSLFHRKKKGGGKLQEILHLFFKQREEGEPLFSLLSRGKEGKKKKTEVHHAKGECPASGKEKKGMRKEGFFFHGGGFCHLQSTFQGGRGKKKKSTPALFVANGKGGKGKNVERPIFSRRQKGGKVRGRVLHLFHCRREEKRKKKERRSPMLRGGGKEEKKKRNQLATSGEEKGMGSRAFSI